MDSNGERLGWIKTFIYLSGVVNLVDIGILWYRLIYNFLRMYI